jgi:hypothetical protein
VWLCAVCSAKIRARRSDEAAEAMGRHVAAGGGLYLATGTLPHERGDALVRTFGVLTDTWAFLNRDGSVRRLNSRYGLMGTIRSVEVTHGRNGWHPHTHAAIFTATPVPLLEMYPWVSAMDRGWAAGLARNGWPGGVRDIRFRVDMIETFMVPTVAGYITKPQDKLSNELSRADLKGGRWGSRTPLQILADYASTGAVDDLNLWLEYEQATIGRSAIRWSKGLRAKLLPDVEEQTDDEIAAEEVGGDDIGLLMPHLWYRLADIPGAPDAVLAAVEGGGFDGLVRQLLAYRLDPSGVLSPNEWAAMGHAEVDHLHGGVPA